MDNSEAKKVDIVCSYCGSRAVYRDAFASWNLSKQCWELSNVYDDAYCSDCEGETSLTEMAL